MLSTTTTLLTSLYLLAGVAVAQTSSNSTGFDINQVPLTMRNQWCRAETDNCPKLCGGPTFITENSCLGSDLSYACTCTNGTGPAAIDQYLDTLPNNICQETFKQCNIANPGSDQCKVCPSLAVSSVPTSATSSAAAASSTDASGSASAASGTGTGNAAAGGLVGKFDVGVLVSWGVVALGVGLGAVVL